MLTILTCPPHILTFKNVGVNLKVPTYPSGQIGFVLAYKAAGDGDGTIAAGTALCTPTRPVPDDLQAQLRYYTNALHSAAFVLPAFAASVVNAAKAGAH